MTRERRELMVVRINAPGTAVGYLELKVLAVDWQEAHEIALRQVRERMRVDYCVDAALHRGIVGADA